MNRPQPDLAVVNPTEVARARRRAIDDPMARRSIRRRRFTVWLLAAAAVLTFPTGLGTIIFGAVAATSAVRLHRVRAVLRDHSWRSVDLESESTLFTVVSRDFSRNGIRHREFRAPRRFVGEAAGPTGETAIGGEYSVVRLRGSDQIHLVRGLVVSEVHDATPPPDDLSCRLAPELLPVPPCTLSSAGLETSSADAPWLTVIATKQAIWRAGGELLGRITRSDLDLTLVDRADAFVIGRDRRFWDDVFWSDAGDRGVGRGRRLFLTNTTIRRARRRWPILTSDDGTLVAVTTPTPRHRWSSKSVAISVRSGLDPIDRALVVLQLADVLRLSPPRPSASS